MMTEQAKVPAIRFAGFTDPWEQRKLGEIVSIGAGAPPSAFSAGNFLYVKVDDLNESSHFQFDSAQRVDANTAVKPIRKGSIIFAKRGAAILGNKVRVLGKTAYIDTNMMALEPRGVDADFLWLFINQTGLYRIADTSTIPQINNKHIEPYPVDIPNMAEQQAIGTFFSRLDDLITLHQRKYDKLVIFKKSMLEKMFPKDGESVPEIRFAGFTDPWEQRKLSEVATFGGGHTPPMADPDNYEDGYVLWVTSQDVKSNYLDRTTTQITEKGAKELTLYPAGSLVMVTRSGILRHTLPVAELRKPSTVNQDIRVILPQGECCGEWLLQFFISHNKELLLEFGKTGTTVESVDFGKIKDMLLYMPSTVEQQQIGDFFAKLDSLITLHQRKLELLQNIKKSLLDKMFV
ncbi:restriction endonuclease subunit S [Bifidobacterium longum]|nr:restriction endonuclease subunit S [Bifidobacterium longum]MDB6606296.1 restriction endonuclease subunit S [Bifidobacterium longum]MDB6625347.1 restriction endonuclease subunit S [Bifidobacterium longum]